MSEFQNASRSSKTSASSDIQKPQSSLKSPQKDKLNQPSMEGLRFADQSQIPLTREEAEAKQAGKEGDSVPEGKPTKGKETSDTQDNGKEKERGGQPADGGTKIIAPLDVDTLADFYTLERGKHQTAATNVQVNSDQASFPDVGYIDAPPPTRHPVIHFVYRDIAISRETGTNEVLDIRDNKVFETEVNMQGLFGIFPPERKVPSRAYLANVFFSLGQTDNLGDNTLAINSYKL